MPLNTFGVGDGFLCPLMDGILCIQIGVRRVEDFIREHIYFHIILVTHK